MDQIDFRSLTTRVKGLSPHRVFGRISVLRSGYLEVEGLARHARLGDRVEVLSLQGPSIGGEIIALTGAVVDVLPEGSLDGFRVGDRVRYAGCSDITPDLSWIGRVLDAFGQPLSGPALNPGPANVALRKPPPPASSRRPLGDRLATGLAAMDTFLPLVRGQRIGIFAGSGVGKSTLLGQLARGVEADLVVVAMIGERGREVEEFLSAKLGPDGRRRAIVFVATSDQPAPLKRRAAWAAMATAEHFRAMGLHVLLVFDSLTRFAEAHREIALSTGEGASMGGYPPSTSQLLMELVERAGPGSGEEGDITAVFSVLVAGSDFEEPLADLVRGVLDGHVVLDRSIAERGRFPAIDIVRSVSRSLPEAASVEENALLLEGRRMLSVYEDARLMVQAGLYTAGNDAELDRAVTLNPDLERFLSRSEISGCAASFARLEAVLQPGGTDGDELETPADATGSDGVPNPTAG